jgi:hypothetical protein
LLFNEDCWNSKIKECGRGEMHVTSKESDVREDLSLGGTMILKWVLDKTLRVFMDTCGPVAGCCEHGNEHPGSAERGELFDYLRSC